MRLRDLTDLGTLRPLVALLPACALEATAQAFRVAKIPRSQPLKSLWKFIRCVYFTNDAPEMRLPLLTGPKGSQIGGV